MRKQIFTIALIAGLSSCSNSGNTTDSNAADSTTTAHNHEAEHKADTTAILPGQRIYFKNLQEGQIIKLPFVVEFGVDGMEVEPASTANPNKGHHHLVVDNELVPAGTMVPMGKETEGYYHFGKGQTLDTLKLSKYPMLKPGKHKISLQFANGMHMSYGPMMSTTVNVEILP
ncbi:MAG TPA: DUF4399 domain-containing protein [Bacteroidia bacterium]